MNLDLPPIVLGSQSPRRAQILNQLGISFIQSPSTYEEVFPDETDKPDELVKELAFNKGQHVTTDVDNPLIITSDTLVVCNNQIFGKPKSREQAFHALKTLRDTPHQVVTGLCIQYNGTVLTDAESTTVTFQNLSDKQLKLYAQTAPILDKAGSYEVQGTGAIIVESINGCYYNVMGLPVKLLKKLLSEIGYNLWDFIDLSH